MTRATLALHLKSLWTAACEYDRIPVDSKFVTFSEHNPHIVKYNELMGEYLRNAHTQREMFATTIKLV